MSIDGSTKTVLKLDAIMNSHSSELAKRIIDSPVNPATLAVDPPAFKGFYLQEPGREGDHKKQSYPPELVMGSIDSHQN